MTSALSCTILFFLLLIVWIRLNLLDKKVDDLRSLVFLYRKECIPYGMYNEELNNDNE